MEVAALFIKKKEKEKNRRPTRKCNKVREKWQ